MPKICPKIYPRSILWYIGEPVNNYFSVNVVFFLLRGGIQLKNRYFRSITIFLAFFHTILALVCLRDGLFGPLLIVFKTKHHLKPFWENKFPEELRVLSVKGGGGVGGMVPSISARVRLAK